MPTTYFPFRWTVGTLQEILDSSSGNWVRIKSITDLRVLSFVGSSEAKYSLTELNFGRLRERGWCIVLRSPRFTTLEPPYAASCGVSIPNCLAYKGRCRSSSPMGEETCPGPAMKLSGPLAARSPGLRLALALEMEVERHCSADEILQGQLIDLFAFVDVDGAPDIPLEAGVE